MQWILSGERFGISWKLHILCVHVPQFLDDKDHGMAIYAEQAGEAAHAHMKPVLRRWKVKEDNPTHGQKLLRAAANYTRFNLWFFLVNPIVSIQICVNY